MNDQELFDKYIKICQHRINRLIDIQESAMFMALRDMLKRGKELSEVKEIYENGLKEIVKLGERDQINMDGTARDMYSKALSTLEEL